ncbi:MULTISPECIES: hypothetical protein [Frankia]|uniref:hypothetical protein n=1 Tax=Frankia TaxID=1854 RepID=UPI001E62D7F0|nr:MULTISPECIES: hypothetical protein [Frankia]
MATAVPVPVAVPVAAETDEVAGCAPDRCTVSITRSPEVDEADEAGAALLEAEAPVVMGAGLAAGPDVAGTDVAGPAVTGVEGTGADAVGAEVAGADVAGAGEFDVGGLVRSGGAAGADESAWADGALRTTPPDRPLPAGVEPAGPAAVAGDPTVADGVAVPGVAVASMYAAQVVFS